MARALFGANLEQAVNKLNDQFWAVKTYVDASSDEDFDTFDPEFKGQIRAGLCAGLPNHEANEIDKNVAAQVKVIENICLPVLQLEGERRKR